MSEANLEVNMASKTKVERVIVFKDEDAQWQWSALSKSGKSVAKSPEGYRNRAYAMKMAKDEYPDVEAEYRGWGAA